MAALFAAWTGRPNTRGRANTSKVLRGDPCSLSALEKNLFREPDSIARARYLAPYIYDCYKETGRIFEEERGAMVKENNYVKDLPR